jgi:hypothetical protein
VIREMRELRFTLEEVFLKAVQSVGKEESR